MNIRLLPEAVEAANTAALWYGKRRLGLGDEFLAELQSALATIEERSHGMPVLECYFGSHDIRRQLLKGITRHRVPWIQEADEPAVMESRGQGTLVEEISW